MFELSAADAALWLLGYGFFTSTVGMFIGFYLAGGDGTRRPRS